MYTVGIILGMNNSFPVMSRNKPEPAATQIPLRVYQQPENQVFYQKFKSKVVGNKTDQILNNNFESSEYPKMLHFN